MIPSLYVKQLIPPNGGKLIIPYIYANPYFNCVQYITNKEQHIHLYSFLQPIKAYSEFWRSVKENTFNPYNILFFEHVT